MRRLRQLGGRIQTDALFARLCESPHHEICEELARRLAEQPELALDTMAFDRAVLLQLRGGRAAKDLVRERVDRDESLPADVLLAVARGPNRSDADWAMSMLARRAIGGEDIPEFVVKGGEAG